MENKLFLEWRSIIRALQFTCSCGFICVLQSMASDGCCILPSPRPRVLVSRLQWLNILMSWCFSLASTGKHDVLFSFVIPVLASWWFSEVGIYILFQVCVYKRCRPALWSAKEFCSMVCSRLWFNCIIECICSWQPTMVNTCIAKFWLSSLSCDVWRQIHMCIFYPVMWWWSNEGWGLVLTTSISTLPLIHNWCSWFSHPKVLYFVLNQWHLLCIGRSKLIHLPLHQKHKITISV
jgi:hypothetical protein